MYRNKAMFLMSIIIKRAKNIEEAVCMSIAVDKIFDGFKEGFPMLYSLLCDTKENKPIYDGKVYFMQTQSGDRIKIGFSKNVEVRKKQNSRKIGEQLDTILELSGNFEIERKIHDLFSFYCDNGEWYECNEALTYYIECMKKDTIEKKLGTDEAIDNVIWKMWFDIIEEREFKKILCV